MSILSVHTGIISISGGASSPNAKRMRSGASVVVAQPPAPLLPAFILQFEVPVADQEIEIMEGVKEMLLKEGSALPESSRFYSNAILRSPAVKAICVTFESAEIGRLLGGHLLKNAVASNPEQVTALPRQPTSVADIDPSNLNAKNCKVQTCPFHNFGSDVFASEAEAATHGRWFHKVFLSSLDVSSLASIGWKKCDNLECSELTFGSVDWDTHKQSCQFIGPKKNAPAPSPEAMFMLQMCPSDKSAEFRRMIDEGVAVETLRAELLSWTTGNISAGTNDNT